MPCLRRTLQALVSSDDLVGLRDQLRAQLEADDGNQAALDEGMGFYISKTWRTGFKQQRSATGTAAAKPPTAGARARAHARARAPRSERGARRRARARP